MQNKVRPIGDRIFCEDLPDVRKIGSIIVVRAEKGNSLDVVCSKVIAVGPDVKDKLLRAGSFILHIRTAGVRYDGAVGSLGNTGEMGRGKFVFIRESEAIAEINPEAVEALSGQAFFDEKGSRTLSDL